MNHLKFAAAAAGVVFVFAGAAMAQEPTIDELLIAEEAYVQRTGDVQSSLRLEYGEGDDVDEYRGGLEAEFGLLDRLELEGRIPYEKFDPEVGDSVDGVGDAEIGGAFAVLDDVNYLALKAGLMAVLPTGDEDEGLGDDTYKLKPSVTVGRKVGPGEIHTGVELETGGGTDARFYAAGVVPFDTNRLLLEFDATDADGHRWRVMPGVMFKPNDAFEGGVGVPIGLSENTPDIGLILKGTLKFRA